MREIPTEMMEIEEEEDKEDLDIREQFNYSLNGGDEDEKVNEQLEGNICAVDALFGFWREIFEGIKR